MRRLIIGMSGATGAIYGIRLLEILRQHGDLELHLVISKPAELTIRLETDYSVEQVAALAHVRHDVRDLGASISSGSFLTDGMVVAPCSMRTLSGIANSFNDNLLVRAADVILKERRRLILVPRESPLHLGHLRLMTQVTEMGAIVVPPMPAFHTRPSSVDDIVNYTVARLLDLLGVEHHGISQRWAGAESYPER